LSVVVRGLRTKLGPHDTIHIHHHSYVSLTTTKLHLECGFADHQKMLLVFLFASDEEFRQQMMPPEILACDTIFGVEQSNKGLFTIAGLDGNNNAFNCGRAFIPNEKTLVFQLLFPTLLPSSGEIIYAKEFETLRPDFHYLML
jgi:hypothetical protein